MRRTVCLEFDSALLGRAFPIRQVRYSRSFPEFDPTLDGNERTARLVLTKYEGWIYEQEWRLLDLVGEHKFPPESLTGVIFGCATTREDKEKIRRWAKRMSHRPKLYQAEISRGTFALEIKKVEP